MFGNTIGPAEIGIVLVIALLIFGPKKLPELGKGLGRGMRDFKRAVTGDDDDDRKAEEAKHDVAEAPAPVASVRVVDPSETEVVVTVGTSADEGR